MTASSASSTLARLPTWPVGDGADDEMVSLAAAGCPDAFQSLVIRHQHPLFRFCYHYLRDAEDAREVCQDTFVRAHRALPRYRHRARFETWLFRIALNLCHDRARSRARSRATVTLEDHDLPCPAPRPDQATMQDAALAKLERGLQALPPSLRTALVLTCLDGRSHDECAEILKCSPRAVEGRLYRARKRLSRWWAAESE